MEATRSPAFTRARIVALALIALATLGLAYLHFARATKPSSRSRRARDAGQLTLQPCHYATVGGSARRRLRDAGRAREPARSALAADRAAGDADSCAVGGPGVPIFRLQGGPGISNMSFTDASRFAARARRRPRRLPRHRWIVEARLPGGRVGARARRRSPQRAAYRAAAAAFRACATRLQQGGVHLAGYTLPERVDDLEAARRGLGYEQVDLLSESAGTRMAMIYAWRYPSRDPSIGDDRRQSARRLPLGRRRRPASRSGRTRRSARRTRRVGTARPTSRPRSARRSSTCRGTSGSCRSGRATSRQPHSSASSTRLSDGGEPIEAPKTIDTLLSASEARAPEPGSCR